MTAARTPVEKLALLVPHWAEHTLAHIEDMRRWQTQAVEAGPEAARAFATALESMTAGADALARVTAALARRRH